MGLLLLEALGALLVLLLIVWWTMFSGRQNGELPPSCDTAMDTAKEPLSGQPPAPNEDRAS